MGAYHMRQVLILLATVLCTMVMISGCAPQNSKPLNELDEVEIKTADPLGAFEEVYEAIHKQVEEGSLPPEASSRAAEIRIGLKKYLIQTEAQLKILRLDVLHGDNDHDHYHDARQIALQKMLELVAERERTKMAYLQQLQVLSTAHLPGEKARTNGKLKDIEIEIGPENIDSGRP